MTVRSDLLLEIYHLNTASSLSCQSFTKLHGMSEK